MDDFPGSDELYDVYDEEGRWRGRASRKEVHSDPSLVHRAVHVLVFRPDGRLLLQKRVAGKDIGAGKWDTSVGGHVDAGEDYLSAARREMKEELGLEGVPLRHIYDLKYRTDKESEDIRTYLTTYGGEVFPHWFEIEAVREWTCREIEDSLGKDVFTENFEHEWRAYQRWLEENGPKE
ncbi:MAG: NUDIX domain-containing protein [bacterium]